MNNESIPPPSETTFLLGEKSITVTTADAKEIRTALLDALAESQLGDRDELLALTKPLPAWIDSEGLVMVGGWLLQARGDGLVATYRLSQNQERAVGYAATVKKDAQGWYVDDIVPEKIRFRH